MLRRLLWRRETAALLALVGLLALVSLLKPSFATWANARVLSRQSASTAIVALGVLFVMLTGGIDLSVGATAGLSGVVCGLAMARGAPPSVGVLAGLAAGTVVGCVNGSIVAYTGATPFIVTLGMLSAARGMVLALTQGDSPSSIPGPFIGTTSGSLLGVPASVVVLGAVALAAHGVLACTALGHRLYAMGRDETAAGLPRAGGLRRVRLGVYVVSGLLSAVTGILFVARFRSVQADAGFGMELDAIAAAVVGGTSLTGGQGTVLGVLIGAGIVGVTRNGLTLMSVSLFSQELSIVALIAFVAILDVVRSRRR